MRFRRKYRYTVYWPCWWIFRHNYSSVAEKAIRVERSETSTATLYEIGKQCSKCGRKKFGYFSVDWKGISWIRDYRTVREYANSQKVDRLLEIKDMLVERKNGARVALSGKTFLITGYDDEKGCFFTADPEIPKLSYSVVKSFLERV